jgi:thiosulfate/3-mercaptopyruvate sulfurtransferase
MKNILFLLLCSVLLSAGTAPSFSVLKQINDNEPWTSGQLESPEDLAKIINDPKLKQPLIFCIGPSAIIKNSIDIGLGKDSANLAKFKQQLDHLPKDAEIVIYCGCCPFEHCPNIRPAFRLLNQLKFTHHKLLNLEHNIKIDWINKGYPVQ